MRLEKMVCPSCGHTVYTTEVRVCCAACAEFFSVSESADRKKVQLPWREFLAGPDGEEVDIG